MRRSTRRGCAFARPASSRRVTSMQLAGSSTSGGRAVPDLCARRACRRVPLPWLRTPCLQLLPQPALPEVPGSAAKEVDRCAHLASSAGAQPPRRLHPAERAARARSAVFARDIRRAPVGGERDASRARTVAPAREARHHDGAALASCGSIRTCMRSSAPRHGARRGSLSLVDRNGSEASSQEVSPVLKGFSAPRRHPPSDTHRRVMWSTQSSARHPRLRAGASLDAIRRSVAEGSQATKKNAVSHGANRRSGDPPTVRAHRGLSAVPRDMRPALKECLIGQ